MKWKRPLRMLRRILLVLLLLAIGFVGIAFLPGSVEGNYRGRIVTSCGCDGISFINLRQGRMILYFSAHPPALIMGRYTNAPDGAVEIWGNRAKIDGSERLDFKAYPRFLITKFVSPDEGRDYWCWKWPSFGRIGEALQAQELSVVHPRKENTSSRDIYDRNLKWIRHETKIGKGKWTVESSRSGSTGLPTEGERKALQHELQQKESKAVELEGEIADLKELLQAINPRLQLLEAERTRITEEWKNSRLKLDAELKGILEEPSEPMHETFRKMLKRMEKLTEENEELKQRLEEPSR